METVSAKLNSIDQKKIDFVLAEVRKHLETNRQSQVTGLSVDPDYRSGDDTYLVSVLLEAHELKCTLGVLVTLHPVVNGWKATMGFID